MPTIFRTGPYRFFFYSGDRVEPSHIHVERDTCEAKFWLDPIRLARSYGFSANEINNIEKLIVEHRELFLENWNEFFNG